MSVTERHGGCMLTKAKKNVSNDLRSDETFVGCGDGGGGVRRGAGCGVEGKNLIL